MPVAYTFGSPYALGTLFLEIQGWFAEKLNVTLWFQFLDGSVCDGSRVCSLGPSVCVTDVINLSFVFLFGALFGDKNRFTFIGLSVLPCAIYHTFPCQSLVRTKMDRGARWLSGRVSDSGARGPGFETYRRRVVSLSKTLYSPKVLVNYPGSDGSVPTWLKNCWLGR